MSDTIYKDALKSWGFNPQMDMAIEEMSETIKAILKYRRNPSEETTLHIAEEIADVIIMINQIEIAMSDKYPNFNDQKHKFISTKLDRVR